MIRAETVAASSPLRVCHLITTLDVGGAELMLARLVERMDPARFRCTVISLVEPGQVGARLRDKGVGVTSLGLRRGRPAAGAVRRLVRQLREHRPDVLQTWLYHADLLGLVAGRLAGVPHVLWNVRSSDMAMGRYGLLSRLTLHACRFAARYPDGIVVNSRAGYDHHRRLGYRARAWFLIPNGVDMECFRPDAAARARVRGELGIPPEAPLIGFVARVDPMKDHETFLRAAALLARRRPDVRFLLAGAGTEPGGRVEALVREAALGPRLVRLGARDGMPGITAALDVAASVSRFGEGFPNVVAEALACGVPCVVTDVGDAARIVGEAGRVVPRADPYGLADACDDLIAAGPEARRAMGRRGREHVGRLYSLARAVGRYEDLYVSVVRGDSVPESQVGDLAMTGRDAAGSSASPAGGPPRGVL